MTQRKRSDATRPLLTAGHDRHLARTWTHQILTIHLTGTHNTHPEKNVTTETLITLHEHLHTKKTP